MLKTLIIYTNAPNRFAAVRSKAVILLLVVRSLFCYCSYCFFEGLLLCLGFVVKFYQSFLLCKHIAFSCIAPLGAFCNTLTCIQVIIGHENQVLVFLSFFTVFNWIFWNKNAANSEVLEGVLGIQGYGLKA